jgi:glucose-fructose oxidoreductase
MIGNAMTARHKVRYAVVGLGHISKAAVLPAFAHATENSELRALVSSDPAKLKELSKTYEVPLTYSYEQYEQCLHSGEVDAVYIALPNSLHCEYSMAAARAGVHVLCEKPMAVNVEECEGMIGEARRGQVKLMIANRLQFDRSHLEAIHIVASGQLGTPRIFSSVFTLQVKDGNIRLDKKLGGGPLYDIGVYCVNAARHLFGEEPNEALATGASMDDPRFAGVDETTSAILRFPHGRLAAFTCSFGAAREAVYEVAGTTGVLRNDPAYQRAGVATLYLTLNGQKKEMAFTHQDQFAQELIEFSRCVLNGQDPLASGEDGLADVRIIEALLRSAATGRPVQLPDPRSSFAQDSSISGFQNEGPR